jgi:tetratricopeptide (TPR) repeat protein
MLPDDRDRAVEYAEAALRAAPPDAAVAAIIESLAQWPDDPVLLLLASRAFKQVGQFEQAIRAGLAALRADPPPRGVHAHLLALLVRAASYEAALGVAERAMDLALPPGEIGPIGLLLRSVPPDDRARDLARRFLRAHPNHRDVPEIARIAGRRPELSAVPVERTRLVDGRPPPGEVFEAFLGKGHLLHSGKRPQAPARDVDLLDLRDVTLNIFPYGFAITDRDGLPLDVGNPSIHADLVAFLDSLPVQDPVDEIFYAADGKWAANNYCHWLLDYLPRILWAERLRPGLPIAVSGMDIGGFRAASLAAIGFDRRRLTVLDAGRYPVARLAVLSNSDHRFFRNALHGGNADYAAPLLDAFPAPSAEPHRHIFLTRPPGNGRTFTNYDDAMAVVRGQGFEVVDPGRHAFAAQVGMMREAVAVAGPHGAGLTNILFCPPGTKVLEIFPRDAGTLPFAMLSAVKGHRYRALIGAGQGMTSIPGLDGNRANFPIDLTELGQALGALRAEAAATR